VRKAKDVEREPHSCAAPSELSDAHVALSHWHGCHKTFLNMLPWSYRRRELLRLRLLQWSVVWAWALSALGLGGQAHGFQEQLDVVSSEREKKRALQMFKAENEQIRTRPNELNTKTLWSCNCQDQPPPLAILGLAGQMLAV